MADAAPSSRARRSPAPSRGKRVLAALIAGVSLEEICLKESLTRKRIEKILRDELRRRWAPPAEDYAKLQIARLEDMIVSLIKPAHKGRITAVDRMLKILDRLDRYHGLERAGAAAAADGEDQRERLIAKINSLAARFDAPKNAP